MRDLFNLFLLTIGHIVTRLRQRRVDPDFQKREQWGP